MSVSDVSISIKDTIVGIIPANFVKPFLDSNMMQLIFLAVLIGIALEKIGEHSRLLKDIQYTMIIVTIPTAKVPSMASMDNSTSGPVFNTTDTMEQKVATGMKRTSITVIFRNRCV